THGATRWFPLLTGQNGGVSMHSIYESELAYFYGLEATGLGDMVAKCLLHGSASERATTLTALDNYPIHTSDMSKLALRLNAGQLTEARALVNANLQDPGDDLGFWRVQDLL